MSGFTTKSYFVDMQPVIDLVGAAPRSTITAVNLSDITPTVVHNEVDNVLEYHLIPKQPQYVSKVQLRGSQQPNWFPGEFDNTLICERRGRIISV